MYSGVIVSTLILGTESSEFSVTSDDVVKHMSFLTNLRKS